MFLLFIEIYPYLFLNSFSHCINIISDARNGIHSTNVTTHNPVPFLLDLFDSTSFCNFSLGSSSGILLLSICWSSWVNNLSSSSSSALIWRWYSVFFSFYSALVHLSQHFLLKLQVVFRLLGSLAVLFQLEINFHNDDLFGPFFSITSSSWSRNLCMLAVACFNSFHESSTLLLFFLIDYY